MASSSSEQFVTTSIPRFNGHYDHWSMMMENFLRSKEMWHLVEEGIPAQKLGQTMSESQRKSTEDSKLKDLMINNYLFQAID